VLSVGLGIFLTVVGIAIAVTFVGMLLFGGLDLFEEVGHTGNGTGPVLVGIAVVGVMIAIGGFSLVSPALAWLSDRYRLFGPAAQARERAALVCVAAALVVAAGVSFVAQWPAAVVIVVGAAQVVVAVYSIVRERAVRSHRWQYVVVAVVSIVANPITILAIAALGYVATGRSLT
jgi:hypothetical protein